MEAEKQKTESEAEHLQRAAFYTAAEQACQRLEKRLKKHVEKAQPYFEQKEAFNKVRRRELRISQLKKGLKDNTEIAFILQENVLL